MIRFLIFQHIGYKGIFQEHPEQKEQEGPFQVYLVIILRVAEAFFRYLSPFQLVDVPEDFLQGIFAVGPVKATFSYLSNPSQAR